MNTPESFRSALGPVVERYLALRQALGRDCYSERRVFVGLDRFLARVAAGDDLTGEAFAQWCLASAHLRSGVRRQHMRVVRNLCLYRRRTEPGCFVPDITQFPAEHQRGRPHIFSEAEIGALLRTALALQPRPGSLLRPRTLHLAIVLLYTSGLRRREAVRLTVGDYDPAERTLLVRASKFPSPGATFVTGQRRGQRTSRAQSTGRCAGRDQSAVVMTAAYWATRRWAGRGLRALFAGWRPHCRRPAAPCPRPASFCRPRAAALVPRGRRRAGQLPYLATYMGHVSVVSTEYYLHFVEAVAGHASDRFASRCSALLNVVQLAGGNP